MPDKPFFVYFAPGATHAPHHVPKEWVDKYARRVRRRLGRPARAHLRPAEGAGRRSPHDAELTARARRDHGMGRHARRAQARPGPPDGGLRRLPGAHRPTTWVDWWTRIDDLGVLDDTIVYYIIGDNGASAEGTMNGAFNEMANFNGMAALETPEFMLSKMDDFGSPELLQPLLGRLGVGDEHPAPVDQAGRLALGWHPQRDDRALAQRHRGDGRRLRSQFTHVIDVAPTILEAAGLPEPTMVNGVPAVADRGHLACSTPSTRRTPRTPRPAVLRDVRQPRASTTRGWSAVTKHKTPVDHGRRTCFRLRRRRLGAVRRQQRLQPGPRPRRRGPGDAGQAAAAVADRGRQVQRHPARRPHRRTARTSSWRAGLPSSAGTPSCSSRGWAVSRRAAWSASRTSPSR